jgi:hypothetical protein
MFFPVHERHYRSTATARLTGMVKRIRVCSEYRPSWQVIPTVIAHSSNKLLFKEPCVSGFKRIIMAATAMRESSACAIPWRRPYYNGLAGLREQITPVISDAPRHGNYRTCVHMHKIVE